MTAEFHCHACRRRIARRGKHWATGGAAMILCTECVHSLDVHRRLFPGCRTQHDCITHVHPTTTAAGVQYLQTAR